MKFFKQLFCKHKYEYWTSYKADGGMTKVIGYKCSKCGKVKIKTI